MYAPSMEFVEGTGDDDDVFLAFGLSPGMLSRNQTMVVQGRIQAQIHGQAQILTCMKVLTLILIHIL